MNTAELLNPSLPTSALGEGPLWDERAGIFYWVDITGCKIHRYHLATQKYDFCATPSTVGFIVQHENGILIVGLKDGIYEIDFDSGASTPVVLPSDIPVDCRFNDGKCDRQGRLWSGTMHFKGDGYPVPLGQLYRYDGNTLATLEKGVFITNGMGWSPDSKIMYFTDTVQKIIWQYDFDAQSGTAENKRVFRTFSGPGRPDGLTVDSHGRILTAQWPGWGIEIYTPDGEPDGRIALPVPQVSSCAFGGTNLKTLFITTAQNGMTAEKIAEAPLSGQVFAIDMDVPGLAADRFTR